MKRDLDELATELADLRTKHQFAQVQHVASGGHYVINDFAFNAVTDAVDVIYNTVGGRSVRFNRDWREFLDGRFVFVGGPVKGGAA